MMIDAHAHTPSFVKISKAKKHDKNFLKDLKISKHSMIVFDRAYNRYLQFAKWSSEQINSVCRLKSNANYEVVETFFEQERTGRFWSS